MTKIAPQNPGSTFNYRTGMWTITTLETVWSCPEHEYPTAWRDVAPECDECGEQTEVECLDCLFGERLVKFDEDGWATLTISRRRLFFDGANWVTRGDDYA